MNFSFRLFLTEIFQKDHDELFKNMDMSRFRPDLMPFNDLFKGEMRLLLPIDNREVQGMIQDLEQKGWEVDLSKGMAEKTIVSNYGGVERKKKQGQKLTRLIQNEFGAEALDKFNRSAGWVIMVSRHPKDLMRMSDFQHMQNCHSPPMTVKDKDTKVRQAGLFWNCVAEEIKEHGVVAYLIKAEEATKINLNADEVFSDPARDIEGIIPASRIRLRTFETDEGKIALLPEKQMYGSSKPQEFADTIMKWIKGHQNELTGKSSMFMPWRLRGGTYIDTPQGAIKYHYLQSSEAVERELQKLTGKRIGPITVFSAGRAAGNWKIVLGFNVPEYSDLDNTEVKYVSDMITKTIMDELKKRYPKFSDVPGPKDKNIPLPQPTWHRTSNVRNNNIRMVVVMSWEAKQDTERIMEGLQILLNTLNNLPDYSKELTYYLNTMRNEKLAGGDARGRPLSQAV